MVAGTKGYDRDTDALVARYDRIPFAEKHAPVLHLIPNAPVPGARLGAGTGADAAWLAGDGHRVVAVEPADALRQVAMSLHGAQPIAGVVTWSRLAFVR